MRGSVLYTPHPSPPYLHHEEEGVEDNEGHDEVLEGRGDDDPPELVLEAVPLTGHVALQRLRVDGKVDAGFLHNFWYQTSEKRIFFLFKMETWIVII